MSQDLAGNDTTQSDKAFPRFADLDDLEELKRLGYPMEEPEKYFFAVAGPTSQNPGRIFLRHGYTFCFWADSPKAFDSVEHEDKIAKRNKQVEIFTQRQRLMQDKERFAALQRK